MRSDAVVVEAWLHRDVLPDTAVQGARKRRSSGRPDITIRRAAILVAMLAVRKREDAEAS